MHKPFRTGRETEEPAGNACAKPAFLYQGVAAMAGPRRNLRLASTPHSMTGRFQHADSSHRLRTDTRAMGMRNTTSLLRRLHSQRVLL